MTPGGLAVASAQAASLAGDVAANVQAACRLVGRAADGGARVVVLPELFLTGYAAERWRHEASIDPADPRLAPLADLAREREIVVVASASVRRGPDRSTLSILLVDPSGVVSAPYDKQHLTDEERDFFTAGDHGASIVVDGWELGLGICYDGSFPEHAAAAVACGATAYLCPAAFYAGSDHRRDLYYAARALDNGIYVVFAGLTGRCGDRDFSGGSAVYDPEGRPLDRVGSDDPAVVFAELDPAEVLRVQALNPIGRDRLASQGPRRRVRV